jgi:hypothetical protein
MDLPTVQRCDSLPTVRPADLRIHLTRKATYPMPTGRITARVMLVAAAPVCKENPCWIVEPVKFDQIYGGLYNQQIDQISGHAPRRAENQMQHMDERSIELSWSSGHCHVEASYAIALDVSDLARFDNSWKIIGVVFGSNGPQGMTTAGQ